MILIGVSGHMQSGKDTLANYLVEKYGFVKLAFASKLKQVAMDVWGLSYDECYDNKTERSRMIMQQLGTEVARTINENTWIDYLFRQIRANDFSRVVICDVRFPNEAEAVIQNSGKMWRIERDKINPTGDIKHLSEIALDDYDNFDATLLNNLDIPMLHSVIDLAMEEKFPGILTPNE